MSPGDSTLDPDWPAFRPVIDSAQKGDPEALSAILVRYYPVVNRKVHQALARDVRPKRPWIASIFSTGDVVQDVFQSVLGHLNGLKIPRTEDAFIGYLAVLVRNRLIDSIRFYEAARRDGRRAVQLGTGFDRPSPAKGPSTRVEGIDDLERFRSALLGFTQREQVLVTERLEHGTQFQDLAEMLCYPSADAARKAFYSAQAALLLRLHREGPLPEADEPSR